MMAGGHNLATYDIEGGLALLLQQKRLIVDDKCQRFVHGGDAEALHDLRVALRRLHSIFAAFSEAFPSEQTFPNELHQLQKQTNPARDLEVTIAILTNSELTLPWLEEMWQQQLDNEYKKLRHQLPAAWQALRPKLDNVGAMLCHKLPSHNLGSFASTLIAQHILQLKKRRKHLCDDWSDKDAHKLRILGKQIRYLLEPFSEDVEETDSAVGELKRFQEQLGSYHDLVVLRDKLRLLEANTNEDSQRSQLKVARKKLKRQSLSLRKHLLRNYCASRGKPLTRSLERAQFALSKCHSP